MDGFRIDRLPDGGFLVCALKDNGQMPAVFASSRIDQALGYLRDKLDPREVYVAPDKDAA